MALADDVARFQPNDCADVVAASFACSVCLRRVSWLVLVEADDGASAGCRCMHCDVGWVVSLDTGQYMRMVLAPPPGLLTSRSGSGSIACAHPSAAQHEAQPPGGRRGASG